MKNMLNDLKTCVKLDYDLVFQGIFSSSCISDTAFPVFLWVEVRHLVLVRSYPNGFICPLFIQWVLSGKFYSVVWQLLVTIKSKSISFSLWVPHWCFWLLSGHFHAEFIAVITYFLPILLFSLITCSLPVWPTCLLPSVSCCYYIFPL